MSTFDFRDFEKFTQNWQNLYKEFEVFLKKFLLEMAQRAVADIKRNTPVDIGALKAMWGIGSQNIVTKNFAQWDESIEEYKELVMTDSKKTTIASIDLVGDNLEVLIWNGMEYASFVEYGHRQEPGRYVPAIGKRLKKNWVPGHFMMTIGVDKVNKQMPKRFQKAWEQFLISKGAS